MMGLKDLENRENRPKGTSDWVAGRVREAIFAGRLKPGDRIVEGKLAKELEVGISPVREALQQLEYLGLVTRYLNRGTIVTQLSVTEVNQIYRLRAELEALSVRYALESPNYSEVGKLQAITDQMRDAAERQDFQRFFESDLAFHQQVCRIASDPFLEKCLLTLITPLFAFVIIRLKQEPKLFDFIHFAEQHQQIVNLFKLSDPQQAAEGVREIMHDFRAEMLEVLQFPQDQPGG